MAIQVALHHLTRYRYDRLVALSPHVIRLRPAPHTRTPVLAYSLKVEPATHFINWQQDPFGNYLARLVFPEKARELRIEVDLIAEMTVINPFDFFLEEYAEYFPFTYDAQLRRELLPYLEVHERGQRLLEWLASIDRSEVRTIPFLVDLNQRLQREIAYTIRLEAGVQSCEETLEKRLGSCRDSGWLLVQILRNLGLAARFVSGYLIQLRADLEALDGPSGPRQDFTDLHAWAEVYVPGAGWLGLDPTSGLFAGEGHIPLACTADPIGAAPVSGATGPAEVDFRHENRLTRLHEDPRVTKPYSQDQWDAVMGLGRAIDRDLDAGNVRLTMGGEPTFVSIDDMDSAQWNTAALGEAKLERALDLAQRLMPRFAPGGLLHHGQGKWYPGEPLPRWALSLFWRDDGVPLWPGAARAAEETTDDAYGPENARAFAAGLAEVLGVQRDGILPGYEDALYYLWREGTLPENLDPHDNRLSDPVERRRLLRVFEQGLDHVVGYALPLHWDDGRWHTDRWCLRRGHLFLLPGDSPMGYRLPLESLRWEAPEVRRQVLERDPFEERRPLAETAGEVAARYTEWHIQPAPVDVQQPQEPADGTSARTDAVIRTALCVEIRAARLYVFLPPVTHLEHWLELVAAVHAVAARQGIAVLLEGYEPPPDPRLLRLQITPDPGVIEVNIHPATHWEALVESTQILYEETRLARLGTEKFMLDGRHTGTGGGNHVTLGGPTAAESPLLRRPDLLASLVTYWQHHPSLSYLFSGLFVGPTSQAPRVDEARDSALYELEIALQQVPDGVAPSPWIVDRLLRHLLVDLTGNTHRAEFCIDKLYSPDSPRGRLGLVEFRAFEMPPHAQMSAVQMLLLRGLIAWFWRRPYRRRPHRWGTELHDRFLLPHFVHGDFEDVLCDLRAAGYRFESGWFEPFFEFRFPLYGRIAAHDVELELRAAIEPWHVLGEEITAQGTARFVDSSVERLQVSVRGMTGERHVVTCNGRRVPLHPTGTPGRFVAGVRYKAWKPPSSLHATLPLNAPLVFDLFDTWNRRAIAGCTYHVAHPGGRHYETFPINANEAEARRIARFEPRGHTPGVRPLPPREQNPDCPYTLDLRYGAPCPF